MVEAALTHDTGPSTAWLDRRPLEVVTDEPAPPPETAGATTADEPNVGRTAMIGAALGFAVVTVAITVVGTLGGIGATSAVGLGAFVGIWGGAGFGFMMGATIPLALYLDRGHPPDRPTMDKE